jgi:hypothetical protein
MDDLKQECQRQLESVGVPPSLASQAAEVLVKDDPTKADLGRTEEELHIVRSAHAWMSAKQKQQ